MLVTVWGNFSEQKSNLTISYGGPEIFTKVTLVFEGPSTKNF